MMDNLNSYSAAPIAVSVLLMPGLLRKTGGTLGLSTVQLLLQLEKRKYLSVSSAIAKR